MIDLLVWVTPSVMSNTNTFGNPLVIEIQRAGLPVIDAGPEKLHEPVHVADLGGGDEPGGELALPLAVGIEARLALVDRLRARAKIWRQFASLLSTISTISTIKATGDVRVFDLRELPVWVPACGVGVVHALAGAGVRRAGTRAQRGRVSEPRRGLKALAGGCDREAR
jgi:hypothetical protein